MDVVDLFVADSSVKAVERQLQVYILAPYLFSSKLNINSMFLPLGEFFGRQTCINTESHRLNKFINWIR